MVAFREHLYRAHGLPTSRERCERGEPLKALDSDFAFNDHYPHPGEGLTPDQEKRLKSRKKQPGMTETARWVDIYKILFPNESIPTPCTCVPRVKFRVSN
jgi:hypothetical protein